MQVILFSGKAQHGKDTSAAFLKKHLERKGNRVIITHYGDLVKYICTMFFDWDGKKDEKGRHLLQFVGTDIVREHCPNYWVEFLFGVLSLFNGQWDYVLIPDVRFQNEIDIFNDSEFQAIHIRVFRDGFDNGLTDEQKNHPSETELDNVAPDVSLYNTGSLIELEYNIIKMAEEILS